MPQPFDYFRPSTRADALELLARPGYHATPLIFDPKPTAPRQMGIDAFVDLSLLGLDYIHEAQDGSLHIGALVTLQELLETPLLCKGARVLLKKAAGLVAGPGIRNLSGLWGAIQARSGPQEVILALLALEAKVVLLGAGENPRTLSFPKFYDLGETSLHKGELVLEAILPPLRESAGYALERVARTPRDEAILAAAAVVESAHGTARRIKLALAGASLLPRRILPVEELLVGKVFNPQTFQEAVEGVQAQADSLGDFRGSQEYRRAMAGLVTRRALEKAWKGSLNQEMGS